MFTKSLLIALVLVAGAGGGAAAQSVAFQPAYAGMDQPLDRLALRYRQLAVSATDANATTQSREALVDYIHAAIVPELNDQVATFYTAFDSLTDGAYAVPAALFDLDVIDGFIKQLARTTGDGDARAFEARVAELSASLDDFFTKTQVLIMPTVNGRVSRITL